jgi:hypothetical protein
VDYQNRWSATDCTFRCGESTPDAVSYLLRKRGFFVLGSYYAYFTGSPTCAGWIRGYWPPRDIKERYTCSWLIPGCRLRRH